MTVFGPNQPDFSTWAVHLCIQQVHITPETNRRRHATFVYLGFKIKHIKKKKKKEKKAWGPDAHVNKPSRGARG